MSAEEYKAKRLKVPSENIEEAVAEVIQKSLSIRAVSKAFGISKSTLSRYVSRAKEVGLDAFSDTPSIENKLFSRTQEDHLEMPTEKNRTKRLRRYSAYMEEAVGEVIEKGLSVRAVSEAYGISRSSLSRNVLYAKEVESEGFSDNPNNETFSRTPEDHLEMSEEKNRANRLRVSSENMEGAVREVIEQGLSIRAVAEAFGISKSSLSRNVSKAKEVGLEMFSHNPNIGNRKTFNSSQEDQLEEYLQTVSKMCNGLTSHRIRQLAFEYAETLQLKCPVSWEKDKIAGIDWFKGFMRRHPQLSVRKTETTSEQELQSS